MVRVSGLSDYLRHHDTAGEEHTGTACPSSSTLGHAGRLGTERAGTLKCSFCACASCDQHRYGKLRTLTLDVRQNKVSEIVAEEAFPGLRPMGNETGVTRRPRR